MDHSLSNPDGASRGLVEVCHLVITRCFLGGVCFVVVVFFSPPIV